MTNFTALVTLVMGITSTGLLHTNGRFIELPNAALEALINESKITQVNRRESPNIHPIIQEVLGSAWHSYLSSTPDCLANLIYITFMVSLSTSKG